MVIQTINSRELNIFIAILSIKYELINYLESCVSALASLVSLVADGGGIEIHRFGSWASTARVFVQ